LPVRRGKKNTCGKKKIKLYAASVVGRLRRIVFCSNNIFV